ncbi:MAG TPA: DUF5011 domain-containing protein, partial [Desulfobacterales bacterium]|nr:DUF5011 domain-containing protein [Desulfobacterales bacterium]
MHSKKGQAEVQKITDASITQIESILATKEGVYTINYSVTDSNGNTARRERTVYVGQNDFGT